MIGILNGWADPPAYLQFVCNPYSSPNKRGDNWPVGRDIMHTTGAYYRVQH